MKALPPEFAGGGLLGSLPYTSPRLCLTTLDGEAIPRNPRALPNNVHSSEVHGTCRLRRYGTLAFIKSRFISTK
jgi:hypothetical protein